MFPNSSTEVSTAAYLNETELYYNATNATNNSDDWKIPYKRSLDILFLLILILLMIGMGCEITWGSIVYHLRRPSGFCIGIFSQFMALPLCTFCILLISNVTELQATGMLIISCSPGGAVSNIFTYFCDGDSTLSVAMTACSTVMGMGMMPLNIWLYGRHFETSDLVIPYMKMTLALVPILPPVLVGMVIRKKFPKIAPTVAKIGATASVLVGFICLGLEIVIFPNMFTSAPIKLYVLVLLFPFVGLTLGYGLAALMKQNTIICKTVAFECGAQNVLIALTVISLSFPLDLQADIVALPWLYFYSLALICMFVCVFYHLLKRFPFKKENRTVNSVNTINRDSVTRDAELTTANKRKSKPVEVPNGKQNPDESVTFI